MDTTSGEASLHVVYLQPERNPMLDVTRLESELSPCSITVVHSLNEAVDSCDGTVDCLLTEPELNNCTGVDLLTELGADAAALPTVLLVDGSDGTVPVSAVTEPFADVVAVGAGGDVAAVVESIRSVVPDFTQPSVGDVAIADAQSMTEWKANLFDQFFTKIPVHMYVKDDAARHVLVSEGSVDQRIHPVGGEYLGRRDIDGIVPESEAREPYEDDLRVIETGEHIRNKAEYYAESGRWFLTSKVPWENDEGEVVGVLGTAQEITERKERERQLKTINHLVRHNLRNKLNVITGRAGSLHEETRYADEQTEAILRAATALSKQLDKQQRIINILERPLEATPLNLSEMVSNEVEALREAHPEAVLSVDLEPDVVAAATDDVASAVSELVENAIVHSESDRPRVEIVVESGDDCQQIRIMDDCDEIPAFEVEILTGQRTIDQLNHSTGLGLWLSRWAVDYSNGTISFERRASGGNEITITVPDTAARD